MNLGYNIKLLRISKGLTQRELALVLKIKQNTLSQYENGSRQPDIETLMEIANYFEVSTDYLLKEYFIAEHPDLLQVEQNMDSFKNYFFELSLLVHEFGNDVDLIGDHIRQIEEILPKLDFLYEHVIDTEVRSILAKAISIVGEK